MSIIKMLRHSNWVAVNKDLVKAVGCNAAYLLGYLAHEFDQFQTREELTKDGYFYATSEDVESNLGLSRREQDTAIRSLVLANLVTVATKGVPAKRHFLFDENSENALYSLLVAPNKIGGMRQTGLAENAKQECTKTPNKNGENSQTIIYKELIKRANKKKGKSGDFQSPIAPQKAADEKAEFSEWLAQNNFTRLSKTSFFLEKEKSCAKKEKHGEAGYLATLDAIDAYLGDNPKYLDSKKDFGRIFDNFGVTPDYLAAKNDLNRVFSAKFQTPYTLHGKAAEKGLNGVISQLEALGGAMPLQQKITGFFDALATLPKFDNPNAWKPQFINSDFSVIIAELKASKSQANPARETYKERDARLEREKREADKARLKASAEYDAMRAQIIRILDNEGELQDFHKASQAYKDIIGGDQTPF